MLSLALDLVCPC